MDASKILHTTFYFGVTTETHWRNGYDVESHTQNFLIDAMKLAQYKVELIEVRQDNPNPGELSHMYKVLEIIQQDKEWWSDGVGNTPGSILYAWDKYENCYVPDGLLSYSPQVMINDNCYIVTAGYRSLIVPWETYETVKKTCTPLN